MGDNMHIDKVNILDMLSLVYEDLEETESPLLYVFTVDGKYGIISCYGEALFRGINDRESIGIFRNNKKHIVCVKDEFTKETIIYKAYDNGCKVTLKKLIQSEFTVDRLLQEAIIIRNDQVYGVINYKGTVDDIRYRHIIYHRSTEEILCVKFIEVDKVNRRIIDKVDIRNKRGKIIKRLFGWSDIQSNYYMIGTGTLHNRDVKEVQVEYSQDHKKSVIMVNGDNDKLVGIKLDSSLKHCLD